MEKRNQTFDFEPEDIQQESEKPMETNLSDVPAMENIAQGKGKEREFRLIDALPEAIYLTDAQGCLSYYNPAAVEFSGYKPELGTDQWCVTWKLYYSDGTPMPHDKCPMAEALEEGRSIKGAEAIAELPNGERKWFEAYPSPIRDNEGTIIGGINMLVDITDRKHAEEEMQEVNDTLEERVEDRTESLLNYQKQLRSLASKLSRAEEKERHRLAAELHDNLGQMLAVAKMKIDLFPKEQVPNRLASDIDDLKKLLDDSLTYTRELMSDLKPPPTLDKEDIRAAIKWLAKKMVKYDLEVIVDDDGQSKRASDEIKSVLLQCVRELLLNIDEHADVNEAFVSMRRNGNQTIITVEDEGKGFDVDAIISSSTQTSGYGLFNINERIDLVGGHMKVSSELGKGTKVTLFAPLKPEV